MKLLTHNLLSSHVRDVGTHGFPLRQQATEVRINPMELNPDFVAWMIPKVEWAALVQETLFGWTLIDKVREHRSVMEEPNQGIREKLAGPSPQGMNPHLPTEPHDGKPDTTGLELVLKVRIQDSKENDFIEIELQRQELSYQKLLQVSCSELGIPPEQVEKMRKLPNTLLRKDKDIQRLQDFQEIELLLVKSGNPEWTQHTASARTETPCYNSNAAKMTY